MSETFKRYCLLHNEQALPASPYVVSKFVKEIAPLGIEKVWPEVRDISRDHYVIGLADPTAGGLVASAINEITKIDPPRSWPKEEKARFMMLPYDLQRYVLGREAQRDAEVRRAQNDAAAARNELKKVQTSEAA